MKHRVLGRFALAVAATVMLAACDSGSMNFASISGVTNGSNGLRITPATTTLRVGATTQLSTNATADQQSQLQWSSSNSIVAAVSPTGLVTGGTVGSATISVRSATDTTNSTTSTVTVTP